MYREIVTKAVVGKGKISNTSDIIISVSNTPSKVLGCWIINHYFVSSYEGDKAVARGKYDVHIWYGCNKDSDTAIHKQTIEYIDEFSLKMKNGESLNEENELISKCSKYPVCSSLILNDSGNIIVKVEKELHLDVIGEAKIKVQIDNSTCDEWVDNSDEINEINTNYLNK